MFSLSDADRKINKLGHLSPYFDELASKGMPSSNNIEPDSRLKGPLDFINTGLIDQLRIVFGFHGIKAMDRIIQLIGNHFVDDNDQEIILSALMTRFENEDEAALKNGKPPAFIFLRQYAARQYGSATQYTIANNLKVGLTGYFSQFTEPPEDSKKKDFLVELLLNMLNNFLVLVEKSISEGNDSEPDIHRSLFYALEKCLREWIKNDIFFLYYSADSVNKLIEFLCECLDSNTPFDYLDGLPLSQEILKLYLYHRFIDVCPRHESVVLKLLFQPSILDSVATVGQDDQKTSVVTRSLLGDLASVPRVLSVLTEKPLRYGAAVLTPVGIDLDENQIPLRFDYCSDYLGDLIKYFNGLSRNKKQLDKPILVIDVDGTLSIDGVDFGGCVDLELLSQWLDAFKEPPFSAVIIMTNSTSSRPAVANELMRISMMREEECKLHNDINSLVRFFGPIIIGHDLTKLQVLSSLYRQYPSVLFSDAPFHLLDDRVGEFYLANQIVNDCLDLTQKVVGAELRALLIEHKVDPMWITELLIHSKLARARAVELHSEFLNSQHFENAIESFYVNLLEYDLKNYLVYVNTLMDLTFTQYMFETGQCWQYGISTVNSCESPTSIKGTGDLPSGTIIVESPLGFMSVLRDVVKCMPAQQNLAAYFIQWDVGSVFDKQGVVLTDANLNKFIKRIDITLFINQLGVSSQYSSFGYGDYIISQLSDFMVEIKESVQPWGRQVTKTQLISSLACCLDQLAVLLKNSLIYTALADCSDLSVVNAFCNNKRFTQLLDKLCDLRRTGGVEGNFFLPCMRQDLTGLLDQAFCGYLIDGLFDPDASVAENKLSVQYIADLSWNESFAQCFTENLLNYINISPNSNKLTLMQDQPAFFSSSSEGGRSQIFIDRLSQLFNDSPTLNAEEFKEHFSRLVLQFKPGNVVNSLIVLSAANSAPSF